MAATTKPGRKITFRDLLSQLNFESASKLLRSEGKRLIIQGGRREIDLQRDAYLGGDLLRVKFPGCGPQPEAVAQITFRSDCRDRLHFNCTSCDENCIHLGAMVSMLLENKTPLGLAVPPKERTAVESLSESQLVSQAITDRRLRARSERMRIVPLEPKRPWSDYLVTSTLSGKCYRVALRGMEPGLSYCSCPDFKTNTLGTCKHLMKVEAYARRKFTVRQLKTSYRQRRISVFLRYGGNIELFVTVPDNLETSAQRIVQPLLNRPIDDIADLVKRLEKLAAEGQSFHVYPDAEQFIQQRLHQERIGSLVGEMRQEPAEHPLRTSLLKVSLLPYQVDGIAFAVGAGRAILADDMGLGKTIQGVGVAELLARQAGIAKVLVICPASLKSQWRNEIHRFCDRSVQLIAGRIAERRGQYVGPAFFTVCNYEQVLKDIMDIEQVSWDLIILDEGQRIKNWESKTSRVIKGLRSTFALVLSGTPLENRLDELYSVVQFIDDRRLGPGFRFFNRHRMVDEKGKVLGYRNLEQLRESLRPILLRRTRHSVKLQLPERTDEIVRIPPTDEQKVLHDSHMQTVAQIVAKPWLTEMDLLRLRMSLLMCRLAANGTYFVNKQLPNFSTKLERLAELLDDLVDELDRKVILFSEWTTTLDMIEPLLKQRKLPFVRLDGSVPQIKRPGIIHEFQSKPECRFILMTNAGSTGLNLQEANTVINFDLPWNPAILEQRIARAHRMGQKQNVQVFNLVTEKTLEENLLVTLQDKRELALAALDTESNVDVVEMTSGAEALKERLEILLGAKPDAFEDRSQRAEQQAIAETAAKGLESGSSSAHADTGKRLSGSANHREQVAAAGGEMLGAVFQFLGALVQNGESAPDVAAETVSAVRGRLEHCLETTKDGQSRITFTLPDTQAVDQLAKTLAQLMSVGKS